MKVDKSSWHYKVWALFDDNPKPTTNLCAYFWRVVGKMASLPVFIMMILVTVPFWAPILVYERYRKTHPKLHRHPGVLRSYLRAKKERVCPLIEFEEPTE